MAQAYTPGLQITERSHTAKLRELPIAGRVLVKLGAQVCAKDIVLAADLPGELEIIRVADKLGYEPEDVAKKLKVGVGDEVKAGDLVCEVSSFFGLFQSRLTSPYSGTVEFFNEANAHLGIRLPALPITIQAYIGGVVTAVEEGKSVLIETEAAVIQGIFGVGGERQGVVFALDAAPNAQITPDLLPASLPPDSIIIGGASFTLPALKRAAELQAACVVTGSIDAETLKQYVGFEIGVSITGDEDLPFTLIITEGFGSLPLSPRIVDLAKKLSGKSASVNGATQVRAGALRPEIIAPLTEAQSAGEDLSAPHSNALNIGSRVRLIRVPYFGQFATVTALPSDPQKIDTGAIVRILQARTDSGEDLEIPRANVELV